MDVGDHQYQLKICPDQGQTNDFSGLNQTEKNGAELVRSVGRVNESDVFDSTFGRYLSQCASLSITKGILLIHVHQISYLLR